jgi:adenosine deaminase
MIDSGLNVTINTDDPSISRINLSSEYQTVHKDLGISMDMIGTRVKAAAQGAFLPDGLRSKLANAIETEFMRKLILPD